MPKIEIENHGTRGMVVHALKRVKQLINSAKGYVFKEIDPCETHVLL